MSQENVEVVRAVVDAFVAGLERGTFNGGRDSGLLAEDFEFSPAPELARETTTRGEDEFAEWMRTWTEDFEDWSMRLDRLIDAPNDRVVAFMNQSGTGKGSSVRVDLDYGGVYEVREGQVVRFSLYMTPQQALEAAGLSE